MRFLKYPTLVLSISLCFAACDYNFNDPSPDAIRDIAGNVPAILADTTKPAVAADTTKPAVPADTTKPAVPADTTKPAVPADTIKPVVPADTTKPTLPADTTKPTVPADTTKPVIPTPGNGSVLLRSDLEDQNSSCWSAGGTCGIWRNISNAKLVSGVASHSGTRAMSVTFSKNEEVSGASLPISAESLNVRAWYNFAEGFDFGQGIKIGRISSFNAATQMNDIDMVMTVRSSGSVNQCGTTNMTDMGLFFNGRPVGFDWGSISVNKGFQRGRWYAIEYQVVLNTPGQKNGSVKIWVDGVLSASKTGINIRGNGGSSVKLNSLRIGGWYSNSANGNSCVNPSQPSTVYVDDVAVGTSYIGLD